MRRARFHADSHFEIVEASPAMPGAGEVRVAVEACGICGTDLHFFGMGLMQPGHTPGHEMMGTIDAIGSGVDDRRIGERVAIEPISSCGDCALCAAGQDSICRETQLYGVHRPGGLSEHIVVPADRTYSLPGDIDPAVGALAEPIAVAVHGLSRGGFEKGQRVLVLGSGTVGLVTLIAAQSLGAGEVWMTARHAHQADMARRLGANRIIGEADADATGLDRLGREHEIDLVVETVGGHADTVADACAAVRPGGQVSVVGVFMSPITLPPLTPLTKEVTLAFSNCYHRPPGVDADFGVATGIVDRERERLASLVTDRFALEDLDHAFARAADKQAGALKVSVLVAPATL